MRKGAKHTPETLAKIRAYRHTEDAKKRISESCKEAGVGRWKKGIPYNKGKTLSEETKRKISLSLQGREKPYVALSNKTRVISLETREKRRKVMLDTWKDPSFIKKHHDSVFGKNNVRWKKDRTAYQEKCRIRKSKNWKTWREAVFKRDSYRCQECMNGGYLEPHHIVPIRKNWGSIFDIKNGITLCRPCHKRTMGKELLFEERYKKIISLKGSSN